MKEKVKRYAEMAMEVLISLLIAESGFIMLTQTNAPEFLALGFIFAGIYFAAETLVHDELLKERIDVYIDMDGCLAVWEDCESEEELLTRQFWETRRQERNMIEAVKILQRKGVNVYIATHYMCNAAKAGKGVWLFVAGLDTVPVIYVPYGQDKSLYVRKKEGRIPVLVDDYSKNLHAWEAAGYVGVKFRNSINGTKGTWTKKDATVFYYQRPEKIAEQIISAGMKKAA